MFFRWSLNEDKFAAARCACARNFMNLTAPSTAQRGHSFLPVDSFHARRPKLSGRFLAPYTSVLLVSQSSNQAVLKDPELTEREQIKREKDEEPEDDTEAKRIAFIEIDWHDYVIVQPSNSQPIRTFPTHECPRNVEAYRARQAAAAAAIGSAGAGRKLMRRGRRVDEDNKDPLERKRREEKKFPEG
ncbi:hypothetical protein NLI96_g7417 [Meripilus lineatus]|uniref:Uncharacterized protein n=1 Tax=Meripilus lineatus TaxID=2056292 RepID=A0AAD5YF04_9APHY|nr:hypothetical protein NLI96_g7417 [Physisporinus lineatus]